jgi:Rod binding domain-containing protein
MEVSSLTSHAASLPGILGQPGFTNQPAGAQTKAVAGQFEAIMLRQFLQESVGSMMGSGKEAGGSVYGYLLTDVFASQLAAGGGLGLTQVIEQQLTPKHQAAAPTAPSVSNPVQS